MLLSMPFARAGSVLSVLAITCGSAVRGSEGSSFENAAASDEGSSESLRSKASSTSLASVAVRLFLAVSASCAQVAARSAELMVPKLTQQLFAQRSRLLRIEGDGDLALATATAMSIMGRSRRHMRLAIRQLKRAV